jgi:hypothetical protein
MDGYHSRSERAENEPSCPLVSDKDRDYARDNIGDIAERLFGTPSRKTAKELRFFDDGKLVVNTAGPRAGTWKIFSEDTDCSRDAFGLVMYALGCDFKAAVEFVVGIRTAQPKPTKKKVIAPVEDEWVQIIPPPADAPAFDPQTILWKNHDLTGVWPYNAPDGSPLFYVVRYETTIIGKDGLPKVLKKTPVATYGHFGNGHVHWRAKGVGLNILNGLDELAARPGVPVLVVEGEKTAAIARLIFPEWVVVCWKGGTGNIENIDFGPLRGRIVYFLPDADAKSQGLKAMQTAQKKAAAAGAIRTTVVIPPAEWQEAKPGWDLADDLPPGWTVEGIKDFIINSDSWTACGLPAYYNAPLMPARQARRLQHRLISDFIPDEARLIIMKEEARQRAEAEMSRLGDLTPVEKARITRRHRKDVARENNVEKLRHGFRMLITGSQGTGKSSDALKAIAKLNMPWLRIAFTLPTVEKAWEAMMQYNSYRRRNSLPAYVVRGTGAFEEQPDQDGNRTSETKMCARAVVMNRLAAANLNAKQTLCPTCPFRDTCGTRRQEAELAEFSGGVFFMAREYVFLPMPVEGVHMLIGDESLTTVAPSDPVYVDPIRITEVGNWSTTGVEAAVDAMAVLTRVHRAVTQPGGILDNLRQEEVTAKELRKTAAYLDDIREAAVKNRIDGTMSDEEIERILNDIQRLEFGAVARLLRQLSIEVSQPRSQANTVCMRHPKDKDSGEILNRLAVFHLKKPRINKDVPVLLLDGTGNPWLNRKIFGEGLVHHHVPIERSAVVVSTKGKGFSRQSLTGTNREDQPISDEVSEAAATLRRQITTLAESFKESVFMCSTMRAEAAMIPDIEAARMKGADIATAHFADVRGKNKWQDYTTAMLIGREEVTPWALEDLTRPFLADDPEPLIPSVDENGQSCYVLQSRARRMRDGTVRMVRGKDGIDVPTHVITVSVHPDPRCEAVHEQIREAELLQAIDRVRAIYNHRTIYLLNDLVLDITYDSNLSWRDMQSGGTRFDIAFARTGRTVFLDSPGEWSRCFEDLWPNKNTAKCAIRAKGGVVLPIVIKDSKPSNILLGKRPPLCMTYQRPGKGQQPCKAIVFAKASEARAVLEKVVGPILDNWTIDPVAALGLNMPPTVPAPLTGNELDEDFEPAAFEPDEPFVMEQAATGQPIALDTSEGMEAVMEAARQMRVLNGFPVPLAEAANDPNGEYQMMGMNCHSSKLETSWQVW